ncbi:MAG: HAMP domain-containing histidine kinase [Bacteriovoracaceae bacterium]|nr:HAMP domain-containing histidine kinase [Bacteriovoracaceae bacterium]
MNSTRIKFGLFGKLMLPVAAVFTVLFATMHFIWRPLVISNGQKHFVEDQISILQALEPGIIRHMMVDDYAALYDELNHLRAKQLSSWIRLELRDDTGKLIYPLDDSFVMPIAQDKINKIEFDVKQGPKRFAKITLWANWNIEGNKLIIQINQLEMVAIILISFFLTGTYLWYKKGVHIPIKLLEQAAKKLAKGNYIVELPLPIDDEVGHLINSFDQMRKDLISAGMELELKHIKMIESSKMASLGKMAGGIGHEINTPLTIIHIAAEHIKDESCAPEFNREVVEENVQIIEDTVFKISKIIKGLLVFSRDVKNDPFEIVKIKDIIEDTLNLFRQKLEYQNINLMISYIPEKLSISCRQIQISQVLLNLLSNSADAISEIEQKWIKVNVVDLEDKVLLQVIDSGKTPDENIQKNLFVPFFTSKQVGKGTGLGLSISKGLIEAHYGRLILNTSSNNTCFEMYLKKNPAADMQKVNYSKQKHANYLQS